MGTGTPRLPKDEFRRLFEAYVRFEEEQKKLSEEQKKLSEQRKQHEIDLSKIHDPSLQDAVEKIRQVGLTVFAKAIVCQDLVEQNQRISLLKTSCAQCR